MVSFQLPERVVEEDTDSIVVRWDDKGITTNVNNSNGHPTLIPGRTRALEQTRDLLGKCHNKVILPLSPRESERVKGKWKKGRPKHHTPCRPPLSSRAET